MNQPAIPATWTIRTLLAWSTPWLGQRGIDSPRLDGELLLAKALGLRRIDLFLDPHRPLTPTELGAFKALIVRRAAREPVAHILGMREFWGIEFESSGAALIPRPETELLVETVLAHFPDRSTPLAILEPCVGSGALLCALLKEYPQAEGVGSDLSAEALALARCNVERCGHAARVTLVEGDLDASVAEEREFDVVVVNPPYIASGELEGLQPEVRDWEPRLALDGGADGLVLLKRLPALFRRRMRSGGVAVTEIGYDQGEAVVALFRRDGFEGVELLRDYHRLPRAVVVRG
ncbi:MAG: peptide chain release factor N(5)-glutamine methyltransferase [Magnetococcales bacterium]|nr:peptide chain release factor N(5)-glutamine methyltransferase [Magnetococcales bacterium]MBF0260587.1 peptide chain release factor N(5)-glutamine methyltransferase [Magnetococcales bacterium]